MERGKHSLLQKRLVAAIDAGCLNYEAFPELRCSFGNRSVVPDVVVIEANQLPLDENGDIVSTRIEFAPPWVIEIFSPAQSQTKVTGNILHSIKHGTKLGWLLDPNERSILVYRPNSLPDLLSGADILPLLGGVSLTLTVDDVFAWMNYPVC
jgi:Uma2 family endonuclease